MKYVVLLLDHQGAVEGVVGIYDNEKEAFGAGYLEIVNYFKEYTDIKLEDVNISTPFEFIGKDKMYIFDGKTQPDHDGYVECCTIHIVEYEE